MASNTIDYATAVELFNTLPIPIGNDPAGERRKFVNSALAKFHHGYYRLPDIDAVVTEDMELDELVRALFENKPDVFGRVTLLIDVTAYNAEQLAGELDLLYGRLYKLGSDHEWTIESKVVEEKHGRKILTVEIDGDYE